MKLPGELRCVATLMLARHTVSMIRAMVVAHRGVADRVGENTLEAFLNAVEVGADMVEFDVRRTCEGEMIAFHDASVNNRPVSQLTRAEIEAAGGVKPPLLAEVLEACAGRIRLDVELKEDGYVADVMGAVRESFDESQMLVTSFLPAVLAQAKQAMPEVKTGLLVGRERGWLDLPGRLRDRHPIGLAGRIRADYLALNYQLAETGLLRRAAAAGLPSLLWTVNSPALIRKYAADPRVVGIITDVAPEAVPIVAAAVRKSGLP